MLVTVDRSEEFNQDFQSGDELMQYVYTEGPAELTAGTKFALESMLLAGALFIVGQAIAAYYRKSAAKVAKQRHDEVLAKLDQLTRNPNIKALGETLALTNYTVQIRVDPTEEALLTEALLDIEKQLPSIQISRAPATGSPAVKSDASPPKST